MSAEKSPSLLALEHIAYHAEQQTALLQRILIPSFSALEQQTALLQRILTALENRQAPPRSEAPRSDATTKPRREDRQEIVVEGELQGIGSKGRLAWAFLVSGGSKLKLKASGEHQSALEAFEDGAQVRVKHSGITSDDRGSFVWVGGIENIGTAKDRSGPPTPAEYADFGAPRQASQRQAQPPPPMPDFGGGAEDDIPF